MVNAVRISGRGVDVEPGYSLHSSDIEPWCIRILFSIAMDMCIVKPTASTVWALDFELLVMKFLQPEIS